MKTMKYTVLFLGLLLFASSCSKIKSISLIRGGSIAGKEYYHEIPFEIVSGEIILKANIGGTVCRFFFDTGAINIISKEKANILNLTALAEIETVDVNGNEDLLNLTKIDSVKIGEALFKNQGFAIYDFSQINEFKCLNIDGVIGANALKRSVCQIDMNKKILVIASDSEAFDLMNAAIKVPFETSLSSVPEVELKINETVFSNVTFDYGSNSGIDLVAEEIANFGSVTSMIEAYGTESVGLSGGDNDTTYSFIPDSILFGNVNIDNQIISLQKSGTPTIGTETLKNYIVTIDWNEDSIYMDKQSADFVDINQRMETFGIRARMSGNKLFVSQIVKDSPAFKEGIRLGDQILSISLQDYSDFAIEDYAEIITNGLFPQDSQVADIVLSREDETIHATIEKEVML